MTDLERKAREAAIDHGMWLAPDDDETNYQAFIAGYYRGWSDKGAEIAKADLAAAKSREKEIAELRRDKELLTVDLDKLIVQNGKLFDEVNDWRESAAKAAGESCGDEVHCACVGPLRVRLERSRKAIDAYVIDEEHLESEVVKLRARVAELEGMVPRWVEWDTEERRNLYMAGWVGVGGDKLINGQWRRLCVPPVPLLGEGK